MHNIAINYKTDSPEFDKAWEAWITKHIIDCKECRVDYTTGAFDLCDIAWDKFIELHQKYPYGE